MYMYAGNAQIVTHSLSWMAVKMMSTRTTIVTAVSCTIALTHPIITGAPYNAS